MAGNPQNGAKFLGYGIDRPLSAAGRRRQRRDIANAPHILADPARADPARSGHWSIDILPCRARPRIVPAAFPAAAAVPRRLEKQQEQLDRKSTRLNPVTNAQLVCRLWI